MFRLDSAASRLGRALTSTVRLNSSPLASSAANAGRQWRSLRRLRTSHPLELM